MGEIIGGDMGAQVMHRDERLFSGKGKPLRVIDPDEQRTDQAGIGGHGDGVDVRESDARRAEGVTGDAAHRLNVAARRDFRHNAAVNLVFGNLRRDNGGKRTASVLHHSGGGFVTGRFQG